MLRYLFLANSDFQTCGLHRRSVNSTSTSTSAVFFNGVDVVDDVAVLRQQVQALLDARSRPGCNGGCNGVECFNNPAVPSIYTTGTYPVTTSVAGYLEFAHNPGLATLEHAFPRLTRVGQCIEIKNNPNLATLGGAAFPVLDELGAMSYGSQPNGASLIVQDNPALRSLGSAFASLRRLDGTLYFVNNPLLTDFEALRNLECHGGAWQSSMGQYNRSHSNIANCQGCPGWLLAKPRCLPLACVGWAGWCCGGNLPSGGC